MNNRNATPPGRFAVIVRNVLIAGLLLLSPGVQPAVLAQLQADPAGYERALERLDAVMDLIANLQSSMNRTGFDLEELIFDMFFEEAAGVAEWMREHIVFQPYAGVLRGAEGTLVSGAGNAYDQALLLATLLNAAGYDARIALGRLDEESARLLAATASAAHDDGSWRAAAVQSIGAIAEYEDIEGVDTAALRSYLEAMLAPADIDEDLYAQALATADVLIAAAGAHGVEFGGGAVEAGLLDAAADYAWVEYRLGDTNPWEPLLTNLPEGAVLPGASGYVEGEIPQEHQHRIRIESFVEIKEGDDFRVVPVMTAWERPTANMNGIVVTYANVPSGLGSLGAEANIGQILDASDFFMPYLNDVLASGGMAFDLEGAILEPQFMGDAMAGIFRSVRGGFMDALGALGSIGLGEDEEVEVPLALTAHWLQYTLVSPGGEETVHIRQVFDRVGAEGRHAGNMALNGHSREEAELLIMREDRLMVINGEYRPEWVLDQFFTRFLNTRTFLEYTLAQQYGVQSNVTLEQALASASPLEHLMTAQEFDVGARQADALVYRAEPSVLVFGSGLAGTRDDSIAYSSLDIVTNSRVVVSTDGAFVAATGTAVAQGVWETLVEHEIQAGANPDHTLYSAAAAVADALAAGAGITVLLPGDDPRAHGLTGQAADSLQRDLDAGYVALIPDSFADAGRAAWYRVMADSGETLGITFDGRGQSMTEYTIQLYDQAFTLMFAMKSLNDCLEGHASGSSAQLCCLVVAHMNNVMGLGLGSVVGGIMGAAAGLMFTMGTGVMGTDFTGLDCGSA